MASQSVTVIGDTIKIRLDSDRMNTEYGFRLTDIYAEYNSGDLNGDGNIDILDLVRLKKILVETAASNGASSDIDGSGDTTAVDVSLLRKFLLGDIADLKSIIS